MRFLLSFVVFCFASDVLASPAAGTRGMVASANTAATQAGIDMLRAGGNAVDAAVATAFVLAVTEPYSSGIGGGGFALLRFDGNLRFFDFRETAPSAATETMYVVNGVADPLLSRDGARSVATPGAVAGYLELHKLFGKLRRDVVLAPAIQMAEQGFRVDLRYQKYCTDRLDVMRQDAEISRIFLAPGEQPGVPQLGSLIKQLDLAATLKAIAKSGVDGFYKGKVAELMIADQKARGGIMTLADLQNYKVREAAPLVGSYRGRAVVSSPPPSSGGTILLTILNVLEQLPAATAWHSPEALHTYVEASKYAYADRLLLGDPRFVPGLNEALPYLLDKERAKRVYGAIKKRATPAADIKAGFAAELQGKLSAGPESNQGTDTTHLTTLDAQENAVSMTTTINYMWGAAFVAKGTGVVMNDEMDDFAVAVGVPNAYGIVGSKANAVAPGKVPLSSMTPTLVFEGPTTDSPLRLVVGSPGGSRIPSTVLQAVVNVLDYGADIEKAISLGRIHHQHMPDIVRVEPFTLDPNTRSQLQSLGHTIEESPPWCNATGIAIDPQTRVRTASADRRGVGLALAE